MFNDMSTLVGHFVSSPREREKREICIYKGWIRDKAPPVSAVIDIHREL